MVNYIRKRFCDAVFTTWDGKTVAQLMEYGATILSRMEGFLHLGFMIVAGEQTSHTFLEYVYQAINESAESNKIGLSLLPIQDLGFLC